MIYILEQNLMKLQLYLIIKCQLDVRNFVNSVEKQLQPNEVSTKYKMAHIARIDLNY